MMGWGFASGFHGAGMAWMALFGLLLLGAVILGMFAGIKYIIRGYSSASGNGSSDPLKQLKMRLARGEITPDEYEMLRAHLRD
ncbi:MAG: SHOCT domain-containing protein [Firmicutes bacterium]|jgi:uncharacterized membrane protein|uniref:SHOCT domain-containing protein n=1 Tax=Sulfobacillus benefaciens TaxID=453960 RepID=A0A2T2X4I2_9FIRM|nr:SHOCT domain-containing protein [Bacillota bacterium]MCL5013710.1 SHOCT domain-containing protein [Bacillota bacterium]PSR29387.1 MAG: hypothetical protein C7B43_08585 [Sulfobacillus benefaciens]HBQ95000.1 hypothetical protein [Sulfobacillus sp.]